MLKNLFQIAEMLVEGMLVKGPAYHNDVINVDYATTPLEAS